MYHDESVFLIYWQNLLFHLAQSVQKSDRWLYLDLLLQLYIISRLQTGIQIDLTSSFVLFVVFTQVFWAFYPCFLASLTSHKQKIMKASLSGDSTEFPTSFFSCGLRLICSYSQWTESIRSLHPLLAATFIILENSLCFKCCFSCHLFHNKS